MRREGDDEVVAELTVGYGSVQTYFTTRNRNRPCKEIRMALAEGLFERVEGAWRFLREKDGQSLISLDLELKFAEHGLGMLLDSAFKKAMERILDAFKKRARSVYGSSGTV